MSEINAKQTFKVATFNLRKDSLFDFGNRWRYRKSHAIGEMKRLGASVIGVQELLPSMRTLHIQNPNTTAASLLALRQVYPDVKITWAVEIAGRERIMPPINRNEMEQAMLIR